MSRVVVVALGFGRGLRFNTPCAPLRDTGRTHHLDQAALLHADEVVMADNQMVKHVYP